MNGSGWRSIGWAVVVAAALGVARAAEASSADEADVSFRLATVAYQAGRYDEALLHFLQSNRLAPNPRVMFNIARTFEAMGMFPEAHRWFLDTLAQTPDEASQVAVRESLARIAPTVAIAVVETNPPGATVYIDRRDLGSVATTPASIAHRPGAFRFVVELDGYEPVVTEPIDLRVGTTVPLTFDLVRIVGQVQVDADAPTEVHLGSEDAPPLCTAPCTVDLPPGQQLLFFTRDGYRSIPRLVEVARGSTVNVVPELVPLVGTVIVRGQERGALIEIDGRAHGFTPAVLSDVPVGERTLRVSLAGFVPYEAQVTVTEETPVDLSELVLVPATTVSAASRVSEDIREAPAAITVISGAELRAFAYPTIYEALRGVRGMVGTFDSTYSALAIRGLGQPGDYNRRMLLLSDGAVLNESILFQSYIGYDGRTDLGDVERIEVVRGPGSVLYGTGAVSGVVNLVTRDHGRPTTARLAVGTYDNTSLRGRGEAQFNLGRGGAWFSLSGARSSGRTEAIDVLPGLAEELVDVQRFDAFNVWTTAGNAWYGDFTAQWFYNNRAQTIPTGAYGMVLNDDRSVWQDRRGLLELRYQPVLVPDRLQLFTRAHLDLADFDARYIFPGDYDGEIYDNDEHYLAWTGGAEARTVATVGSLRLTTGIDAQQAFQLDIEGTSVGPDGVPFVYLDEQSPYTIVAGYVVADYKPVPWFKSSLGARLDYWSTVGATLNPRVAAIFMPTDRDTVKLLAGRAFRAPSPWEAVYNDGGFAQFKPADLDIELHEEIALSMELEYTRRLFDRWTGLVSVWATQADDLIESSLVTDLFPEQVDAGSAIVYHNAENPVITRGLDLEIQRDFVGGVFATAYYGLLLADTVLPGEGLGEVLFTTTDESRIPNAPRHYVGGKLVGPLSEPYARIAVRAIVDAPRRINTATPRTTDPTVLVDLVLSGEAPGTKIRYSVGAYNIADANLLVPVADNFASPLMPQMGRGFLANVGFSL